MEGDIIPIGGENISSLAVVTLRCERDMTGSFGGTTERHLEAGDVGIVPCDLINARTHTAEASAREVPDDKSRVAHIGHVSLTNLLWSERVRSRGPFESDANGNARGRTDEPLELFSVHFHGATLKRQSQQVTVRNGAWRVTLFTWVRRTA